MVVNEVLAESRASDPDEAYRDRVRVFVELHNPFPRAAAATAYPPDALPVPLRMGAGAGAYAPYRVMVGVNSPVLWRSPGAAVLPGFADDNVLAVLSSL